MDPGGPGIPGNTSLTTTGAFAGTYTGLSCTYAGEPGLPAGYTPTPCSTQAVDPNFRQPYSAQWNLDIQRAVTNNLTVDLAYVGVHGFKEPAWMDINQPPIGAGWDPATVAACLASAGTGYDNCSVNTAAEVGPYTSKFPYLGQIVQLGNQDFSSYNALQLTVNERTSHGLSFLAGYTYSHALDMLSADSASQQLIPIDTYHPRLNYGNSDNDVRHRFTFSPSYAIPGRKSPGQILQGWSVSGILTMQSGLPWFPVDGTNDLLGTGESTSSFLTGISTWNYSGPRSAFTSGPHNIPCFSQVDSKGAAVLSGCTPYSGGQAPAACMSAAQANGALAVASLMNLGCYVQGGGILTPPAYGTVGNASRNLFSSPHYYNIDLSIAKDWKIKERLTAQFRVEFFNLFNHADFALPGNTGQPSVDPNSGNGGQFGCSCQTPDVFGNNPVLGSGGPRHIQFGLKLIF